MLLLVVSGDGVRLVVQTELSSVPAVSLEVLAELGILLSNSVLANVGNAEKGNGSGQKSQRRGNPEGVLGNLSRIVTTGSLNAGKNPSSDKGTDLANGSGNAVVTTTNTSGAGLGGQQTNVVTGAKLSQTQENTVDDGETSNVLGDLVVDTSHDVTDNGLQRNTDDQSVLGANPVTDKGTNHGSGDVEQVDDCVPSKNGGEGSGIGVDARENGRGVDTESIRRELRNMLDYLNTNTTSKRIVKAYIVEEPDDADGEQSEAIVAEDKQVRSLVPHRFLGELLGLLEPQTEDEENQRENNPDSERGSPDGAKAVVVSSGGDSV